MKYIIALTVTASLCGCGALPVYENRPFEAPGGAKAPLRLAQLRCEQAASAAVADFRSESAKEVATKTEGMTAGEKRAYSIGADAGTNIRSISVRSRAYELCMAENGHYLRKVCVKNHEGG